MAALSQAASLRVALIDVGPRQGDGFQVPANQVHLHGSSLFQVDAFLALVNDPDAAGDHVTVTVDRIKQVVFKAGQVVNQLDRQGFCFIIILNVGSWQAWQFWLAWRDFIAGVVQENRV